MVYHFRLASKPGDYPRHVGSERLATDELAMDHALTLLDGPSPAQIDVSDGFGTFIGTVTIL